MEWFTGFALVCSLAGAAAAVAFARYAYLQASEASADADGIRKLASLVRANESELDNLHGQFAKLRGVVYALRSRERQADLSVEAETAEMTRQRLREQHGLPRVGGVKLGE